MFHSMVPQATREPAVNPPELLDLLLVTKPDWTTWQWTDLWTLIFKMDYPSQPKGLTTPQKIVTGSFAAKLQLALTPASERQLSRFAAQLADEGVSHATIKCYLSAVRHLHIEEGRADPRIGGWHGRHGRKVQSTRIKVCYGWQR